MRIDLKPAPVYSLPHRGLLEKQADWLSEARARILRKALIAQRNRVLDLGSGYGTITSELNRRANGPVISLDRNFGALASDSNKLNSVCADAVHLPFRSSAFDLVFSQNTFLWITDPIHCLNEIKRVLKNGGAAVFIEPDYGGLMEYPPEIELQSVWVPALQRAAADPFIGRKLVSWLAAPGWSAESELLPRVMAPSSDRFQLLDELPLTDDEKSKVESARRASEMCEKSMQVAHLPYYLIVATRTV